LWAYLGRCVLSPLPLMFLVWSVAVDLSLRKTKPLLELRGWLFGSSRQSPSPFGSLGPFFVETPFFLWLENKANPSRFPSESTSFFVWAVVNSHFFPAWRQSFQYHGCVSPVMLFPDAFKRGSFGSPFPPCRGIRFLLRDFPTWCPLAWQIFSVFSEEWCHLTFSSILFLFSFTLIVPLLPAPSSAVCPQSLHDSVRAPMSFPPGFPFFTSPFFFVSGPLSLYPPRRTRPFFFLDADLFRSFSPFLRSFPLLYVLPIIDQSFSFWLIAR